MGITVGEILECKYFKESEVLAGKLGLDRKVQAVTLFDAPDGYKWFKGREFVITTGYLFQNNLELFKDVIIYLHKNNSAGMGVKVERYLQHIPIEIIKLCDKLGFPLITLQYDAAWIEITNAVNALAINKYILQLNNSKKRSSQRVKHQQPHQKIKEIIINLSREIKADVMIYDLQKQDITESSTLYKKPLEYFSDEDFWEPSFNHQKEIICDELQIYRYTNIEDKNKASWICIPIIVRKDTVAYFIILESDNKLDYYDLFAIRLSFTLILYIYEQIFLMDSIEVRFQDELVQEVVNQTYNDPEIIYKKAKNLNLDIAKKYISVCFEQVNPEVYLYEWRENISHKLLQTFPKRSGLYGLVKENKLVVFYAIDEDIDCKQLHKKISTKANQLIKQLEDEIPDSSFTGGIGSAISQLHNIQGSYIESVKAIKIGRYVYPNKKVLSYKNLGPFKLIRIESFNEENIKDMTEEILPLLRQEDSDDLLSTLKVYLECKSNYSLAAKRLYIHSNTVRYRIEKIQQLCNIDLDHPIERLKIELTLRFVK